MAYSSILSMLERPIAYQPVYRRITGSTVAAVMLSQAIYWQQRVPEHRPEGCPGPDWWHHTRDEWELETGLSRHEQDTAKKQLVKSGVLSVRRAGLPALTYYRVDTAILVKKIEEYHQFAGLRPSSQPDCGHLDGRDPAVNIIVPESTTETTTTTPTTPSTPPPTPGPDPPTLQGGGGGGGDDGDGDQGEIGEYVALARRHGGPDKCRDPRGLRRYLCRHGLSDDHRAELAEWRVADAAAGRHRKIIAAAAAEEADDPPPDPPAVWVAALEHLRRQIPDADYALWIEPLRVVATADGVVIRASTRLEAAQIRDRYGSAIAAAIQAVGGEKYTIVGGSP